MINSERVSVLTMFSCCCARRRIVAHEQCSGAGTVTTPERKAWDRHQTRTKHGAQCRVWAKEASSAWAPAGHVAVAGLHSHCIMVCSSAANNWQHPALNQIWARVRLVQPTATNQKGTRRRRRRRRQTASSRKAGAMGATGAHKHTVLLYVRKRRE